MLAIDFSNTLFWAVLIGWIISVVLHEFAHGLVAWLGGDYTIRERGGLTLNPLQYVDPLFSLIIPAVILMLGGVPLPGGVTYVRRDLLRSRFWDTAVSLAGPAMNFLLFLACAIPLHPRFGWVDIAAGPDAWTNAQIFLGTMAYLQLLAMLLNLVPVPPLDGFQAIAPYLPDEFRHKVSTPPLSTYLFFAYFLVIWQSSKVHLGIFYAFYYTLRALGFSELDILFFLESFQYVF